MIIEAIKITPEQFSEIEAEITAILKGFKDFTSPTYQSIGIETTDGMVLLLKPKQKHFVDALNIEWQKFDKSIIKVEEENY